MNKGLGTLPFVRAETKNCPIQIAIAYNSSIVVQQNNNWFAKRATLGWNSQPTVCTLDRLELVFNGYKD